MSSDVFTETFQDSSPTTIIDVASTVAGNDDVIDWTTDCIGDGSDMMAMTSSTNDYDDDINDEVRAMLEADFLDTFTAEFESRYVKSASSESQLYDTSFMNSISLDAENNTSIGQPTCESRDKMSVEYLPPENNGDYTNIFQHSSKLKKRGAVSGKGPSHRSAKKKSKGLPKRPLSKYNLFFQSERLKILDEASQNHTRISFENLAKIIGKRWHDLSEEDSEKFRVLSELDIARYREEMTVYHAKRRNTTPDLHLEGIDDRTISSSSVKKAHSIYSPKSPSSPKRKRKYSDSSVTTTGSVECATQPHPSAKHTPSASPTLLHQLDDTPSENDEHNHEMANILSSPGRQESSSVNQDVPDATKNKTLSRSNDSSKSGLTLPLLQDDVNELDTSRSPAPPVQREFSTQDRHGSAQLHIPSQQRQAHDYCQDDYYNRTNSNGAVILPPRTMPMSHPPGYVVQYHHPYPRSGPSSESYPYYYGNTMPPRPPPSHHLPQSYHPRIHPYSYYCHNNNMYRTVTLPQDHNKEVMMYDPQAKEDRRYTIQYKCYAMKRSEAHAYLSRVSSAATPPETLSNPKLQNNYYGNHGSKYSIPMQQLLHQQCPIPGVEVDLSKPPMPLPMLPPPTPRLFNLPPSLPPLHHYRRPHPAAAAVVPPPPPPPIGSAQFRN